MAEHIIKNGRGQFSTISLPTPLIQEVDKIVKEWRYWPTKTDFVREAVLQRLATYRKNNPQRITWPCHDCGVKEGELHKDGCDMERCPKCGRQLITCDCSDADLEGLPRIPYILVPNLCALCGIQWPDLFTVPDEEWQKYIIPPLQDKVLCLACYEDQKKLFPNGWASVNRQ